MAGILKRPHCFARHFGHSGQANFLCARRPPFSLPTPAALYSVYSRIGFRKHVDPKKHPDGLKTCSASRTWLHACELKRRMRDCRSLMAAQYSRSITVNPLCTGAKCLKPDCAYNVFAANAARSSPATVCRAARRGCTAEAQRPSLQIERGPPRRPLGAIEFTKFLLIKKPVRIGSIS